MSAAEQPGLVAIVDDDGAVRTALVGLLRAVGYRAQAYASAGEFLASGPAREVSCVVLDLRMPGMSGLELQAELRSRSRRLPLVFITAHGDAEAERRAMQGGAIAFLQKPFDDEALLASLRVVTGG